MTAREDILTGKWQQDRDPMAQALRLGELLDLVEREHAHQLAEQIRADARSRHDRDFSDNRIFRLTGAQAAADLIDPEK
ncbi:hypothetical protein [Streptomyces flaveolus]|uniref:hypothetical protein n=1 Tax=Streptomyces flaveolus TaxID=67297 RepID=UPI00166F912B|nr:hypothetical protein [Streptomyces flaveolus]GGQ81180.1 hypothetical protein GCM10010216_48780 [Streptomyces flaveolus]